MASRMGASERRSQLLACGLSLASQHGYMHVSRNMIARELDITGPLCHKYFGSAEEMRDEIVKEAMAAGCIPVLAQAIAMRHAYVKGGLAPQTMMLIDEYMRAV